MRIHAILSAVLILSSPAAFAADQPSKPVAPAMPAPLENLQKSGAEIRYLGKDNGLDGWVTIRDGQEQYFYVTPDGQGIVLGVLFNNKGDIITMRQVNELRKREPKLDNLAGGAAPDAALVPAPANPDAQTQAAPAMPAPVKADAAQNAPSRAEQFYQAAAGASWVALGKAEAPVIYTFIDPQCPHCHEMIQEVRKSGALEKGQMQLRIIPAGLMNETSLKQAANLLADTDGQSALFKYLDGDKAALSKDTNPNTQAVQRNMMLMQDWKLDVTPFSLYKNKNGEIKILRGKPNDLNALAAELK